MADKELDKNQQEKDIDIDALFAKMMADKAASGEEIKQAEEEPEKAVPQPEAERYAVAENSQKKIISRKELPMEINLLQEYTFVCLDIFNNIIHNKDKKIENKLEEWLVFLSQDDPDMIMKLLDRNPEFQKIYEEIYTLCLNMEGMMEMFSKELEIMDRNTVKLMIDEMEEELNETKRKAKKEVDEVKRKAKEEIEEAEKRAKAAEEETERLRRTLEEQKGKRDIS